MLIILETSRAEAAHHASLRALERAQEFARLYGGGCISAHTLLSEFFYLRGEQSSPLVFESTPSRRPNMIADAWANSMAAAMRIMPGQSSQGIIVVDSLTGVDGE